MKNQENTVFRYAFESFGVKIGIESDNESFLKKIVSTLPEIIPPIYLKEIQSAAEHNFSFKTAHGKFSFDIDGELGGENESEKIVLNYFFGRLRLTVAAFSLNRVFFHAGVVGWKGKAIIIPGNSFSGKTTLVSELIKQGAEYYSDEFAVLDENGLNHPFTKDLSMRGIIDQYQQFEIAPQEFGAKIGHKPLPVGAVILTEFEAEAEWEPLVLSAGNGVLEILPHVISVTNNPKFSLQVLNIIANRAIIAKSKRGEAQNAVKLLLKFIETETF